MSFYGPILDIAAKSVESGVLELSAWKECIMHGTHVDDCASAYVVLAEAERSVIEGKTYNIASRRYGTVDEVARAVAKAYGISDVRYVPPVQGGENSLIFDLLINFSQWVGSERLRKDTGWKDKKPLFSEAVEQYRLAYEAAIAANDPGVARIMKYGEVKRV